MKKTKILSLILALAVVVCGAAACTDSGDGGTTDDGVLSRFMQKADYSERNGVKREWNKVSSYFINYGQFQEEMLKYDVAIIGRGAMTADDMQKFKDAGVWTIEYITLGEDYSLNVGDGLGPGGYASYYLYDEAGLAIPNGDWGSYYTDPASPAWKQIVFKEIRRIIASGADGIFMDTVDSVDAHPETLNGMLNLIKAIREEFPDIKMVLNRGFTVVPTLYEILDGVMFELYSTYYNTKVFRYDIVDEKSVGFSYNRYNGVQIVNACRQLKYFPVFAMEYYPEDGFTSDKQLIYDRDWEYDFIPYINSAGRTIGGTMMPYEFRPKSSRGIKALTYRDNMDLKPNGDTSEKNFAYEGNGAKVDVDSLFGGYSKSPLIDGYVADSSNFDDIGWQFANWASAETDSAHYVQITFNGEKELSQVKVYWAYDDGVLFSSREAWLQAEIDGEWVTLTKAEKIANGTDVTVFELSEKAKTAKIRVYQPSGRGSTARPNLMWVSEIAAY